EGALESPWLNVAGILKSHDHAFARGAVANRIEHAVGRVPQLTGNIKLRGEPSEPRRMHLEVNMRRATGIGDGPDGAKGVAAGSINLSAAVALKSSVVADVAGCAWMIIDAVGIALPDFEHGSADDLTAVVQHASRYVRDLPHGQCRLSLDAYEVRVRVGGK